MSSSQNTPNGSTGTFGNQTNTTQNTPNGGTGTFGHQTNSSQNAPVYAIQSVNGHINHGTDIPQATKPDGRVATMFNRETMLIGNGNIQRRQYRVSGNFDSIMVNGTVELQLTQGDTMVIEVETDENLHNTEAIEIVVNQNSLIIQDYNCHYTKMIVYVQFPATQRLKSLIASGTGLVETTNEISAIADLFTASFDGTRKVYLKLYAENGLKLRMNGTSQLTLAGTVQQLANIEQSGTSKLDAKQCKMNQVTAVLQGVSSAYIVAQDEIKVNVQGVSCLFYRGPLKEKIVGAITCKVQEF